MTNREVEHYVEYACDVFDEPATDDAHRTLATGIFRLADDRVRLVRRNRRLFDVAILGWIAVAVFVVRLATFTR